jgi:predicted nucleic acid-binding protein
MSGNYFIDTNILVYCYTDDEPDKSKKVLSVADTPDAFISTQILNELANTLRKKFDFEWNKIELTLSEVSANFNVYVNKPATIEQACQIADKYKFSFFMIHWLFRLPFYAIAQPFTAKICNMASSLKIS